MSEEIRSKISNGFQTVVPAKIRKKIKGKPGDEIIWSIIGNEVFIRIRKKNRSDSLGDYIGKFSTPDEDDSTRDIDHIVTSE